VENCIAIRSGCICGLRLGHGRDHYDRNRSRTSPDESTPLVYGDAPAGLGPDSWENADNGKVNWHARYGEDGDFLSVLFPDDAATLTMGEIASISY